MSTITKIENILGDTVKVWAEIDPTTICHRNPIDYIRSTTKKMWVDARETRSLVDVHGGYRLCRAVVYGKSGQLLLTIYI